MFSELKTIAKVEVNVQTRITIYKIVIVVLSLFSLSFSLTQIDFKSFYNTEEWVNVSEVKNDIVFCCSHPKGWLEAIDFKSNPGTPERLSKVLVNDGPTDLYIKGNHAFLTAGGLHIIDISRPDSLSICGSIFTIHRELYHSVVVIDTIAYVGISQTESDSGGLYLISVADVKRPYIVKKVFWDYRAAFRNMQLIGDKLYGKKAYELTKLDISNRENPVVVSSITDSGDVFFVSDTLLFSTHRGVSVYSIADFDNPSLLGQEVGNGICDMVFHDNFIYAVFYRIGLQIYDIRNPKDPQRIAESKFQDDFRSVSLCNEMVYIAGANKILVFDCFRESAIVPKYNFLDLYENRIDQKSYSVTINGKKIQTTTGYNHSDAIIINGNRKIAMIK